MYHSAKEMLSKVISLVVKREEKREGQIISQKGLRNQPRHREIKSFPSFMLPTKCLCSSLSVLCAILNVGDDHVIAEVVWAAQPSLVKAA